MKQIDQRRKHPREQRFGLRVPTNGVPATFRVLVNVRWLLTGTLVVLGMVASCLPLPRRRRIQTLTTIAGVSGSMLLAAAIGEARRLRFEHVTLNVPDLPTKLDGLTIGQISDIHLGWLFTSSNLQRAIDWLNKLQPNLLALTGDFIARDLDIDALRSQLVGITAPFGVYAVLGNHDYWVDVAAIEQLFKEQGIVLLRNEQRTITVNDAPLSIVGVDCVWEAQHNVAQAFNDQPAALATIVLAHEPDIADEVAHYSPLLQLSGHTHGGHFAMPILGPAFLPRHGLRYFRGLQRVGAMWLYVSRGVGGFPLRLGCRPEVTVFTLRRTHFDEQNVSH